MRRPFYAAIAALAIAALTLYTYRELPGRLFAADDFQWLLNVRDLSFAGLLGHAFDAGAQSHFYRPLVWLLVWAEARAFGLDVQGYHLVSLALHLLNAGLLGALVYRLAGDAEGAIEDAGREVARVGAALLAAAIVAIHPAPFEAVVWISAQSELLAALLLLLALHCWLPGRRDAEGIVRDAWPRVLLATLALALALLAKESAVIGLPLLVLIGWPWGVQLRRLAARRVAPYVLPCLVTIAYVAVQVVVERRNYLLRQGDYGLGPQIVLNPLRGLALIVAPLAGTEHADAGWLVPVGALAALGLLAILIRGGAGARRAVLALALTLLPTAPFVGPPNSRYLYLPVMAAALLLAGGLAHARRVRSAEPRPARVALRLGAGAGCALLVGTLAWSAAGELHDREWRFAAGAGPGGSLWRLAEAVCGEQRPRRLIVVDPPVAGQHVEAIVRLACGADVRSVIVGRAQLDGAIKAHSVVIGFPNGSAIVERTT